MSDSKLKKPVAEAVKVLRSTLEIRSGGTKLFNKDGTPMIAKVIEPAKKE